MGRRIDSVILVGGIIFVVEFKVGEKSFDRAAIDQVWDYGLDLKNFHQASHALPIVPILPKGVWELRPSKQGPGQSLGSSNLGSAVE
jgi:hypothetical protein